MWGCKDMRMQRWKQEHMNLKIQACKDPRIQASVHKHKDVRMRGYKAVKYIKHVGFFKVSPQSIHIMTMCIYLDVYVSNGIYLLIFWCTIHQTLPPQKSLFTISMDMPLETEENPTDNRNTWLTKQKSNCKTKRN